MAEDMIGRWLGPYQITGELQQDTLGTLYTAEDSANQAACVLRLLATAALASPGADERLEEYVRAAKDWPDLPHVPRLLEAGTAEEGRYLVTTAFGGRPLAQLLARAGSFAPRHVTAVLSQVAEALDALHGRGIRHGTLSPEAILVDGQGQVTLPDVGLARALADPTAPAQVSAFTAPEQAGGEAEGPAADIYALGQTVYMLLAGQPAVGTVDLAAGTADAVAQPLGGPAEAVGGVVAQALDADPAARWPTAGAFAAAFQAALAGASPVAVPPPPAPETTATLGPGRAAPAARLRHRRAAPHAKLAGRSVVVVDPLGPGLGPGPGLAGQPAGRDRQPPPRGDRHSRRGRQSHGGRSKPRAGDHGHGAKRGDGQPGRRRRGHGDTGRERRGHGHR